MYWLIAGLIIVTMMGVLSVADSVPTAALFVEANNSQIFSSPILLLPLIIISIFLMAVARLNLPFSHRRYASSATATPIKASESRLSKSKLSGISTSFIRIIRYALVAVLAIGLVVGSAFLALVTHQQAESTEVTDPMRVQALVTIEGISDSVYDDATTSGYRQVATISNISPLVSELSDQDLTDITLKHTDSSNSLSSDFIYDDFDDSADSDSHLNYRVLLNAYPSKVSQDSVKPSRFSSLNQLQPGDQLWMSLILSPLETSERAVNNPSGFDSYRWLRARQLDGTATILASSTTSTSVDASDVGGLLSETPSQSYLQRFRSRIDQGRWLLRQHFYRDWATYSVDQQQSKAVTLSLLTGDRSLINRDTTVLYQLAGISHLLAISGTHVLFLAIVLAGAVIWLCNRVYPNIYRYIPRWQVRWWVMIGAAFIYALFTGFDVPAARTAWMLLAIGLVRLTLLPVSATRVLVALAVLMAWQDPYVLWQAGYWLSFIAVALLLKYDDDAYTQNESDALQSQVMFDRDTQVRDRIVGRVWIASKRIFRLQFWLFIALLPITLLLFGKASLWSLIVNLFAIGLFGWVIVPLNLLAGLFYLLSPTIADSIWGLVSTIIAGLHQLMAWLTSLPALSEAWLYTPVNMALLLMMLLTILPWLLPKGVCSRWLALPPLTLLMMTVYANQQSLTMRPTLYILPTGDSYISVNLLQYPLVNDEGNSNDSTSWLFLVDHRPKGVRTMQSNLTAETLSATLMQQLGSLSVDKVEGVVVQSSSIGLSEGLNEARNDDVHPTASHQDVDGAFGLLPMTVLQLNQSLPISQYWQAGRFDKWSALQSAYHSINRSTIPRNISAQYCDQGKSWQSANGSISIQALTGWREIADDSVWDCTLAIETELPLKVLRYNAAAPLKSSSVVPQTLQTAYNSDLSSPNSSTSPSRIILNADSHSRLWQLWPLLCTDEQTALSHSTWLGHSTSHITSEVIQRQKIDDLITYDNKMLEVALSLNSVDESP